MIELVIKISEDSYKATCGGSMLPPDVENVINAIKTGTPLPKGHGRLIDADALNFNADYNEPLISKFDFDQAPTIVEADVPKRRKGTPLEENDSGYNCENWIP